MGMGDIAKGTRRESVNEGEGVEVGAGAWCEGEGVLLARARCDFGCG